MERDQIILSYLERLENLIKKQKEETQLEINYQVTKLVTKHFEQLTDAYIAQTIRKTVLKLLIEDRTIGVPIATYMRRKKAGNPIKLMNPKEYEPYYEDHSLEEVLEIFNEEERKVAILRLEGYTDLEIATQLDCSRSKIQKLREDMKCKLSYHMQTSNNPPQS
jgi:DNA-binding NarL/FixJ family response regulator